MVKLPLYKNPARRIADKAAVAGELVVEEMFVERRNVTARRALLDRIHGEFLEMRGLSVTVDQAAKLFGLAPDMALRVLGQLAEAQVLRRRHDGQFALRG
jgi:hypothetical protein